MICSETNTDGRANPDDEHETNLSQLPLQDDSSGRRNKFKYLNFRESLAKIDIDVYRSVKRGAKERGPAPSAASKPTALVSTY